MFTRCNILIRLQIHLPIAGLALGAGALLLAVALGGAAPDSAPAATALPGGAPRLVVLGTAQDGGVPQAGCSCERCTAARANPALRRRVASLAIWMPAADRVDLIDATPDIREQLAAIAALRAPDSPHRQAVVDRHPVEGIFLTHAHIGHYLGLAELGFEALNAAEIPVRCSARMAEFLTHQAPWEMLVRRRNIRLEPLASGQAVPLATGVVVEPLTVPHRAEYTDTFGYLIRGPHRTVLYVPDTDGWTSWQPTLLETLAAHHVDLALLDGTFFSAGELPDRDVTRIGHPLIGETMRLLAAPVAGGRLRVAFTHFNHSNPVLGPEGKAREELEARGFRVLAEGEEIGL
jgi:pyrroloquinoline quinone biosynthesis protein B